MQNNLKNADYNRGARVFLKLILNQSINRRKIGMVAWKTMNTWILNMNQFNGPNID
jgi:hypothetical protein